MRAVLKEYVVGKIGRGATVASLRRMIELTRDKSDYFIHGFLYEISIKAGMTPMNLDIKDKDGNSATEETKDFNEGRKAASQWVLKELSIECPG